MIDPKELRIGNLVCIAHESDGPIGPIIQVRTHGAMVIVCGAENYHEYQLLLPIPLTPEWLERCGFEKRTATDDGELWGILNFTLIHARDEEGGISWFLNGYHNDCQLLYVHQLQNLYFALTGEELKIKELV